MKPFPWIWQYLKKYRLMYSLTLLMSTMVIALALTGPGIYGQIIKEVFEEGNTSALLPLLGIAVGVTAARCIIRYCSLLSYENMSQDMVYRLRKDIYKRVQDQSHSFFDKNKVGDIMSRMTGDLDAIRHFVAYVVFQMYENLLTFLGAIIVMFTISWQITLIMLTVAPFIFYFTIKQSKKVKPAFSTIREQFSKLNSVCQENISGNRVVKAFTREDFEIQKFSEENQAYYDANINAAKVWIKYLPPQDFLANMLTFILILAGGAMVIYGKMRIYQLVLLSNYLWAINGPMRMYGWLINDIQRFAASLDKIHGMMKVKVDVMNHEDAGVIERLKGMVEFDNVTFSYDQYNPKAAVLKNISFRAEPGQTVGIVGPTGAGKTTLVNLITRFYDVTDGAVKLDGKDVREIDMQSLRKDITAAMQDVFLFSDTIEGNLAYGVPDADMETLYDAARVADADGFIRKLEDGYDTIIGERGVGLSGGQRQRLSLARAIAANPSILILDDTTSAVDMETEHEIQNALTERYSDRTKFIIAHRISSVKDADLILVLVDGMIIESGTHEELVVMRGYYYGLFIGQYGEYADREENKNGA